MEGDVIFYCERCSRLLTEREIFCAYCGSKKIREATETDPVFLIAKEAIGAGEIEGILEGNNIPYLKKGNLGAGMTAKFGQFLEVFTFYVPFGTFNKATEVLTGIFLDSET